MKKGQLLYALVAIAYSACANSLSATSIFTEDFESPNADPFLDNTIPDNGNWIQSDEGFGASKVGIYDESGFDFTTENGSQAFGVWYNNQGGITSASGKIGPIADGTYTLSVNVGVVTSGSTWDYEVSLLAFDAVSDANRGDVTNFSNATLLAQGSGTTSSVTLSDVVTITFSLADFAAVEGQDLAIRLRDTSAFNPDSTATLYDNVSLDFVAVPESSVFTLISGCFGLAWMMVRRRGR